MDILIICTHSEIAKTIARLIDSKDSWRATVAYTIEEAITSTKSIGFDVILIGSGISDAEQATLQIHLDNETIDTPLVKHYGGGSGLLYAEIYEATKSKP